MAIVRRRLSAPYLRIALSFAVALVTVGLTAPNASAVTGWTGPTRIFDGSYRQVSMAVDTAGKIHAAARGMDGIWYLTNRTGTWQKTRLTTNPLDGYDAWPSLALDSDNRVHMVFERQTCLDCVPGGDPALRYLTDRGRPAGSFPASSTFLAWGNRPSLQMYQNKLFLAYATCLCYPEQYENPLYFMTNISGSWQTTDVSRWVGAGDTPSLRVGKDGHVQIAFTDQGELYFANTGTSNGVISYDFFFIDWVPGAYPNSVRPSLALDSTNAPRIAWTRKGTSTSGGGTYYARWSNGDGDWLGGRFTNTKWDVDLILDANNKPHIVVLPPGAGVYYYRLVNGTLTRQTLSSAATVTSAAVAIGGNGRPVVMYTASSGVPAGIYFARRK